LAKSTGYCREKRYNGESKESKIERLNLDDLNNVQVFINCRPSGTSESVLCE